MSSPTEQEIREEIRRRRYLRTLVDFTAQLIRQGGIDRNEAERLVETMRRQILQLFPGKEETFELIYRRRFSRLIDEYVRDDPRG
ncbi:MAG TPA: hypothetical protein VJB88_08670 [Vicinamibacteria bacterium]|nr:hypothetical protein [Vicinamibacteria bacterium]